jgi:hypothetical protein
MYALLRSRSTCLRGLLGSALLWQLRWRRCAALKRGTSPSPISLTSSRLALLCITCPLALAAAAVLALALVLVPGASEVGGEVRDAARRAEARRPAAELLLRGWLSLCFGREAMWLMSVPCCSRACRVVVAAAATER